LAGEAVTRPLPRYILGEFRHTGQEGDRLAKQLREGELKILLRMARNRYLAGMDDGSSFVAMAIAARPPWQSRNFSTSGQQFAGDANEPRKELVPFECKGIFRSNHFGLIAVRYSMQRGYEWFRLVFDER